MFASARQAIKCQLATLQTESYQCGPISGPGHVLPDSYTFGQLYQDLVVTSDGTDQIEVLVLVQCLQHPERIVREPADSEHAKKLFSWLSTAMHPAGNLLTQSESAYELQQLRSLSRASLLGMQYLDTHVFLEEKEIESSVLLGIIAYTNIQDPWTTETTKYAAEQLLARHQGQLLAHDFIIDHVLEGYIRPLFSGSRTSAVTSQGRKVIDPVPKPANHSSNQVSANKPWKSRDVSSLTVFRWAIFNLNEDLFHRHWHLCIPPLLTLLDDMSTPMRLRGLEILIELLSKTNSKVLHETGLAEVFEDAVTPTLHFLPSLTPTEESLKLLKSAYVALLNLGEARFPATKDKQKKLNFLDRLMRQGVLQGFIHAGETLGIAELLLGKMAMLVHNMGMHSVKHLKDIVPILSRYLTNPFAPYHPKLLLEAIKTTQSVIANCWPRMKESVYRIELIKAITICWTRIHEEIVNVELETAREELRLSSLMLVKSVERKLDIGQELRPLIGTGPRLGGLFGVDEEFK